MKNLASIILVSLFTGCHSAGFEPITDPDVIRDAPIIDVTPKRPYYKIYVWEDVYYGHVDPEYDPNEESNN
jgi:hypothetical protein